MENYQYWWYVLFVKSGTENRVVKKMQLALDSAVTTFRFECFIFETEQYLRKNNRILGKQYVKRTMFPGYVFIETDMPAKAFLEKFSNLIINTPDVIKILNNGTNDNLAVSVVERQQLEYLYRGKIFIEHSIGYKEGEKIKIVHGPLKNREGLIKHINRHNREAIIEIKMFNRTINTKVALELITKCVNDV